MSKKQKGRKHRVVNRTPRPRGSVSSTVPVASAVPVSPTVPVAPAVPVTLPAQAAPSDESNWKKWLGHHAARTYARLAEHGPHTVEELCEAVGYTQRTITKHLNGLLEHGLARQSPEGGWTTTDRRPSEVTAC